MTAGRGALLGVLAFALGLAVAWGAVVVRGRRRPGAAGQDVAAVLRRRAQARGWAAGRVPPREFAGGIDRVLPGEALLSAVDGEYAGHRCAVLLYERGDGIPDRYVACLVRLPAARPGLRIRRRYGDTMGPPNPRPAGRDRRFDRRLRVELRADPDGARLLTAPVRAAVLRLDAVAPRGEDILLVEGRTLRTVVDARPSRLDLDALLTALTDVATELARQRPGGRPPVPGQRRPTQPADRPADRAANRAADRAAGQPADRPAVEPAPRPADRPDGPALPATGDR